MKLIASIILILFNATCISGCATAFSVATKNEYSRPYGGTQIDYYFLSSPFEAAGSGHMGSLAFVAWPLALIDLPFSIIGDTVTLPYTLQGEPEKKNKRESKN
jgi:uncharacterized protein YceK